MNSLYPLLWLVLGGLLRGFDFGRKTIPLVAWLAPIFLLHFSHAYDPGVGMLLIWTAMFLAALFACRGVIPVPGVGYVLTVASFSMAWTLPYLADRLLYLRLPGFLAALVFPLAWVVMEFILARVNPLGSWGSIAYTQREDHPLIQLASVTGLWGISFLIAWFASTVNWAWERQFDWALVHTGLLIYGAVWASVMLAGGTRLAFSKPGRTVRVAAIGWPEHILPMEAFSRPFADEPLSTEERKNLREAFASIQDRFLEASRREAESGARIIVWPEASLVVFQADEPGFMRRAERLAAEQQIHLVMGMATIIEGRPPRLENKAVLVDSSGCSVYSYIKKNPVPGWEARISTKSDGRMPVRDSEYGRLSSAICFDMDFPHFLRQVGKLGADILLVPASDWEAIKDLHHQMAEFRAIENGVSLVRATRWGISTAVDAFGRTSAATDSFSALQDVMVAQVPLRGIPTLYAKLGDWFVWLCMAGLAGMTAWSLLGIG